MISLLSIVILTLTSLLPVGFELACWDDSWISLMAVAGRKIGEHGKGLFVVYAFSDLFWKKRMGVHFSFYPVG